MTAFRNRSLTLLFTCLSLFVLTQCTSDPKPPPPPVEAEIIVPKFDRESAYKFVDKQVSFGPRVVNSAGHKACKTWLVETFQSMGAVVIEQDFQAKAYTGTVLNGTNIIAQYNPKNNNRIILAAHWDSRHIADYDPDESKKEQAILGADDGASGVGILLEIARQLKQSPVELGIDLILFDAEDHGEGKGENYESWCLGSQHWAKNLHRSGYRPKYGILLDMVGAKNARFTMEEVSMTFAPVVMNKVWKTAQSLGYSNYFVSDKTGMITDDHLFVNQLARIPMIDIINRPVETETGFGHYWHTTGDDMSVIDQRTLRAVGQTLLTVIYKEDKGRF